ncbi:MAG: hypothetical protein R2728_04955 [Chitinophagales bacterium]
MNRFLLTIFSLIILNVSYAQDLLILKSYKTIEGVVSSIEGNNISIVKPSVSDKAINLSSSNIELIILNEGYIIDISKIDSSFNFEQFKLNNKTKVGIQSNIIDVEGNYIHTKHFTIKLNEVAYYDSRIKQEASIDKSNVLVTIEKEGEITLHKSADIVTYKLKNSKNFNYTNEKANSITPTVKNKEALPKEEPIKQVKLDEEKAPEIVKEDKGLVIDKTTEYNKQEVENIFEGIDPGNVSQEDYQRKSLEKVQRLGEYLSIISNKESDRFTATKAKDEAFKLFTGERATVETSNVNTGDISTRPIKVYLEVLQQLKYDKVEISWSEIGYVSSLRPDQEGNLWGTVSIKQKFTGYRDGIAIYSDITYKEIEVKFETYQKNIGGEQVSQWDVFLNNIGVAVTQLN